jgi:hypothetical protein
LRFWVYRRQSGEFRWDLDQRLADQYRDGVEVRTIGAKAQALRFERDRAAAAKRIVDRRRLGLEIIEDLRPVARRWRLFPQAPGHRARDLPSRFIQNALVIRGLPRHQPLDDLVQPLAFTVFRVGSLRERIPVRP